MRHFTTDRSDNALRFYTTEQLGEKQSLTPEGFLVVEDVPICRTGVLIYGSDEVPIPAGMDGLIRIQRDEADVFAPEHIASYAGKAVVNDHPTEDVRPENWRKLSVGTVLNPRRGAGLQSDLLIADFVITDPGAIRDVREGKREVSCGYDADYDETGRGTGRQYNLYGNHVALVDKGRCGQRCAIGDKKSVTISTEDDMKTRDHATAKFGDSALGKFLMRAFKAKDEAQLEEVMKDAETGIPGGEESTHIHVHAGGNANEGARKVSDEALEEHMSKNEAEHKEFRDAIAALQGEVAALKGGAKAGEEQIDAATEGELAEEAPTGTADKARKARDSVFLEESFQETIAAAEILSPGIRIPTYDKALNPKKTLDAICKLRRTALDLANATPEGRGMIEDLNGKALSLDGMSCAAVRQLFRSAVAMKKKANSLDARNDGHRNITAAGTAVKGAIRTPADLNKRMAEVYGQSK